MTDITRMGTGYCPECGNETFWKDGTHLCRDCGEVEGPIEGNGPKMPAKVCMMFKHDKPYNQLRQHGYVVTVRSERKPAGPVWISRGYPGKGYGKECEAYRKRGREINPKKDIDLMLHLEDSGFSSIEEWRDKIRENGEKDEIPETAYLHKVYLKRVSIKHWFWKNFEDGSPDHRGVKDLIKPVDNPLAHPGTAEFGEVIVHVAGDSQYE